MKKKWKLLCVAVAAACCLSACGNDTSSSQSTTSASALEPQPGSTASGEKVLVVYFTRLPNTENGDDLDSVVQGGGPYGEIGDDFESADMDAISSASITITEDGVKGNVQTLAEWIAEYTGGDLFSIETVEKYPTDYDELIDIGGVENREDARPELATEVENIDDYSVIYLGFPNWYNDMPMAVYSFLEAYNLDGKTIVPFVTSAGSGMSNAVSNIKDTQPEATVVENGLVVGMNDVINSEDTVKQWVDGLGLVSSEEDEDASESEMVAGTYTDGTSPEFSDTRVKLTINGQEVIIRLYDNSAADAFLERLPLVDLDFYDLSGIEKPIRQLDEDFSLGDVTPGYDPVTGDMVIYRPWGNFTIFYGDFRYSAELVPLGQVESGLEIVAGQTEDFTGTMEIME